MKDIKKLNEDFKDVFRRGVEKVVPKVGKTGYNPAGEGNFGGGFFMSNAPKEDLEKLHFIGYVKFLQDEMNKGHSPVGRVGRVTDDDLKRYDDYKAWYDEYMADMEDGEDEYEDEYEDEVSYDESIQSLNKKFEQVFNEVSNALASRANMETIRRMNELPDNRAPKNKAEEEKAHKNWLRDAQNQLNRYSRRNKEIQDTNEALEQALNEISDDLADKVTNKRIDKRAKAFANDLVKNTPKTARKAKEAEEKHSRNVRLNVNRDSRHGVVQTNAGRMSRDLYYSLDPDKRPKMEYGIDRYSKQIDKEVDRLDKAVEEKD